MLAAARFTEVMPEPQKRSRVTPLAAVASPRGGGHATEAGALLAFLGARAPDHIVHLGGIQIVTRLQRLQHRGAQMLGMQMGEGALALLPNAWGVRAVSMIHAS